MTCSYRVLGGPTLNALGMHLCFLRGRALIWTRAHLQMVVSFKESPQIAQTDVALLLVLKFGR